MYFFVSKYSFFIPTIYLLKYNINIGSRINHRVVPFQEISFRPRGYGYRLHAQQTGTGGHGH